jgi:hypothetical protein
MQVRGSYDIYGERNSGAAPGELSRISSAYELHRHIR